MDDLIAQMERDVEADAGGPRKQDGLVGLRPATIRRSSRGCSSAGPGDGGHLVLAGPEPSR